MVRCADDKADAAGVVEDVIVVAKTDQLRRPVVWRCARVIGRFNPELVFLITQRNEIIIGRRRAAIGNAGLIGPVAAAVNLCFAARL